MNAAIKEQHQVTREPVNNISYLMPDNYLALLNPPNKYKRKGKMYRWSKDKHDRIVKLRQADSSDLEKIADKRPLPRRVREKLMKIYEVGQLYLRPDTGIYYVRDRENLLIPYVLPRYAINRP